MKTYIDFSTSLEYKMIKSGFNNNNSEKENLKLSHASQIQEMTKQVILQQEEKIIENKKKHEKEIVGI